MKLIIRKKWFKPLEKPIEFHFNGWWVVFSIFIWIVILINIFGGPDLEEKVYIPECTAEIIRANEEGLIKQECINTENNINSTLVLNSVN